MLGLKMLQLRLNRSRLRLSSEQRTIGCFQEIGGMVQHSRNILLMCMLICLAFVIVFVFINDEEKRVQAPINHRDAILFEQLERKKNIQNNCAAIKLPNQNTEGQGIAMLTNTKHILVDDQHKVLYCYVPKAGCSWWKQRLIEMNSKGGNVTSRQKDIHSHRYLKRFGIQYLSTYSLEEIHYRLQRYYKFMFTRHPFTRLVSAFRDKFEGKPNDFFRLIPKILRYTRQLNITKSKRLSELGRYNLTFTEFLNYTFIHKNRGHMHNVHWLQVEKLCKPCIIEYDFIGKLESFSRDANFILAEVFNSSTAFPEVRHSTGSNGEVSHQYFRSVTGELIEAVNREYHRDAALFGYKLKQY